MTDWAAYMVLSMMLLVLFYAYTGNRTFEWTFDDQHHRLRLGEPKR